MTYKDITFSKKQVDTFEKVTELNQKWEKFFDPTTFVLNPTILELHRELDQIQEKCDHIWNEEGYCVVCGRKKD